jgi:hypothetical protein
MLKTFCVVAATVMALTSLGGCVVAPRRAVDQDRDGVPNRVDRDRDGDGTPNRVDRRPDNPRR